MIFNNALDLRIGAVGASKAYLGSTLVWPSGAPPTPPVPTASTATIVSDISQITSAGTYILVSDDGTKYVKNSPISNRAVQSVNDTNYLDYGAISSGSTVQIPSDALRIRFITASNNMYYVRTYGNVYDASGNSFSDYYLGCGAMQDSGGEEINHNVPFCSETPGDAVYRIDADNGKYHPTIKLIHTHEGIVITSYYYLMLQNQTRTNIVFSNNGTNPIVFVLYKIG